jgi:acyl-CoA thioesterase-2
MTFEQATTVTPVDGDHFNATYPRWWDGERVFGGLVLAQSIAAAVETVDPEIPLHSLHGFFLRPAIPGSSSEISVERIRDGRSFVTRRASTMVAGKETFQATMSFHVPEEGEDYQLAMPKVPRPDEATALRDEGDPFEVIELGPSQIRPDGTYESTRRAWVRLVEPIGDDPRRHVIAAGYASDMTRAAFRPTSLGTWGHHVDASLDHSLWIHSLPVMDEWNLFDLHTVVTGAGRSFMRGSFWSDGGILRFSMAQEILIRPLENPQIFSFDDVERRPESP